MSRLCHSVDELQVYESGSSYSSRFSTPLCQTYRKVYSETPSSVNYSLWSRSGSPRRSTEKKSNDEIGVHPSKDQNPSEFPLHSSSFPHEFIEHCSVEAPPESLSFPLSDFLSVPTHRVHDTNSCWKSSGFSPNYVTAKAKDLSQRPNASFDEMYSPKFYYSSNSLQHGEIGLSGSRMRKKDVVSTGVMSDTSANPQRMHRSGNTEEHPFVGSPDSFKTFTQISPFEANVKQLSYLERIPIEASLTEGFFRGENSVFNSVTNTGSTFHGSLPSRDNCLEEKMSASNSDGLNSFMRAFSSALSGFFVHHSMKQPETPSSFQGSFEVFSQEGKTDPKAFCSETTTGDAEEYVEISPLAASFTDEASFPFEPPSLPQACTDPCGNENHCDPNHLISLPMRQTSSHFLDALLNDPDAPPFFRNKAEVT